MVRNEERGVRGKSDRQDHRTTGTGRRPGPLIPYSSLLTILLLAACAGSPPPPDWKMNAQAGLEAFQKHYLDGNAKLAEMNYGKARAEAARTGRPDLVARVELARCGVRAAALEFDDCPGYQAVQDGAAPAEQAYAEFLAGRWQGLDAKLLPAHYGPVLKAGGEAALSEIKDPTARLIAAGVLFRAGRLAPAGIAAAVDTASERGWRRPLLAWLGVELKRAEAAGDRTAAARIQRRIDLVAAPARP